jgi:hypothetical protein
LRTRISVTLLLLFLFFASASLIFAVETAFAQKYLPARDWVKAIAVPEPIELEWKVQQAVPLEATTVIVVPTTISKEEMVLVEWVKRGFHNLFGLDPEILVTDLIPERNALVIGTVESAPWLADFVKKEVPDDFGRFPEQGYAFSCTPTMAYLVGIDLKGLRHGLQTLLQIIQADPYIYKYVFPPLDLVDYPAHDMRAMLIPLRDYRMYAQTTDVRVLINVAEMVHMNTVVLQIDNGIDYVSAPQVSRSAPLDKDTLRAIVQYAREAGLEVIPMVNTFSHQDLLLCPAFPGLCLDEETYDPSNPEVYERLFAIFDEVLEVCEPAYFHIGHDWIVKLHSYPDEEAQKMFLDDVRKIHKYLKKKGVQVMMWADMLIPPDRCGGQDNCHGHLGNVHEVIDSLPKDIILIDGHYRYRKPEFVTSDYLLSKGFRVIGCVSGDIRVANDFSKYTVDKDERFLGMMVALWGCFEFRSLSPTGPRKNLREAAEAFWRGGVPPEDPEGKNRPQNLGPY